MEDDGRPDDFDTYWDAVDEEMDLYPAASECELLMLRSSEFYTVYAVRFTSIGPYRIFGYYSVPTGSGPFPGLVLTPRYGSVNHLPHLDDRQRYAVLVIMHRGQRLADQPFAATYPGLLTLGIEDPGAYIYRGIVADCIRGAEFLLSRPEVKNNDVGIIGDDLALITAARRPGFTAAHLSGLTFYRLMEVRDHTEAYPVEEVNDYLRAAPDRSDAVAHTLSYFDPRYHAPQVTATTLINVGDGKFSGTKWLQPLTDELDHVEHYTLTYEGGTDHDWTDAWMASHLGAPPKPRLWEIA